VGEPVRTAGRSLSVYDPCHLSGRIVIESMSLFGPSRHFTELRTWSLWGHRGLCPDLPLANPVADDPKLKQSIPNRSALR
jgi:hypothetical protein